MGRPRVLAHLIVPALTLALSTTPGNATTVTSLLSGRPASSCSVGVGLGTVDAGCDWTSTDLRATFASSGGSPYEYFLRPACEVRGRVLCVEAYDCVTEQGEEGTFVNVLRRLRPNGTWEDVGDYCLGANESEEFQVLTIRWVIEQFKDLDWPSAALTIEPPDGKTLVNFPTNYFTDLTDPREQHVNGPGGIRVSVRAIPTTYTWHWGDGTPSKTTEEPGAPFESGVELQVSHEYEHLGDFTPSVDVTYTGCYYLNGDSDNCETLVGQSVTVPGQPVDLRVISAEPRLVQ